MATKIDFRQHVARTVGKTSEAPKQRGTTPKLSRAGVSTRSATLLQSPFVDELDGLVDGAKTICRVSWQGIFALKKKTRSTPESTDSSLQFSVRDQGVAVADPTSKTDTNWKSNSNTFSESLLGIFNTLPLQSNRTIAGILVLKIGKA